MGIKKLKHNLLIEMQLTKKIYLTNSSNVDEALKFINLIHNKNTGYFCLAHKSATFSSKFFKEEPNFNEMMNYLHLKDLYLSLNSFFIPKRDSRSIRQLNAFWVDLDYYKIDKYKNKTCSEMIEILRADKMFEDVQPSFYVDSGNGMYIFYLINDAPAQGKKLWNKIETTLVDKFNSYGADTNAKDVSRILRLPGSINSKTGRRAKLVIESEVIRYDLNELQSRLLKPLEYSKEDWLKLKKERKKKKQEYKKKENLNQKVRTLFTRVNLDYNRALDIEKLIELRAGKLNGYRHTALYMLVLFNLYAFSDDKLEVIIHKCKSINNTLIEAIEEKDLESLIKSAHTAYKRYVELLKEKKGIAYLREHGAIIYSNAGIIKALDINSNEMKEFKTIIDADEKISRRKLINKRYYENNNKKFKSEKLEETYEKIIKLKKEKMKNKDIAKNLNIAIKTLERYITKLKKQELL